MRLGKRADLTEPNQFTYLCKVLAYKNKISLTDTQMERWMDVRTVIGVALITQSMHMRNEHCMHSSRRSHNV